MHSPLTSFHFMVTPHIVIQLPTAFPAPLPHEDAVVDLLSERRRKASCSILRPAALQ